MKNNNYTKKSIAIFRNWLTAFVLVAFCSFNSMAQVAVTNPGNTTPGLAATYTSLANAITDLNLQTAISGPVTITLTGNESAPAGGYSITAILTGASAVNNVIIQGSGSTITASGALTVGALNDAIFKVIGSDFMTIQNFTMLENAANIVTTAASNNMTEWGVALLYATSTNGAQNITIQNNTITLNRTYQNTFGIYSNSTHTTTSVTTSASATTTAGSNSGTKIYGNTINNVNMGIVVVGPTAAADANTGIDIGGAGGVQANSITNFGTTATFSGYANVSGTVNGILVRNSNGFNVSFNTITSSVGGTTVGTLNGIQIPAASATPTGTFTNSINSNNISLQSAVTAGAIVGITQPSGSASTTSTLNINNNNFNTFGHTVAGASGAITFITAASTHQFSNIISNTFTNITVNTTGSVTFISNSWTNSSASGIKNVNSNSIVTAFNKTGAGGTVTLFNDNGSDVIGAINNSNSNNFSNITVTGATTIAGWSNTDGASTTVGPTKSVSNNTFNNIVGGTSSITIISSNFGNNGTTVSNNTISNVSYAPSATGTTLTGISIGASNGGAVQTCSFNTISGLTSNAIGGQVIGILGGSTSITTLNINNNTVSGITSASTAGPVVAGIFSQNTGTTVNIFKNKVYDIICSSGAVIGINSTATAAANTINISNNYVGRLYATTSLFFQAARGILAQSTLAATFNLYYNTVYLDGTVPTQTYCVYIGGATVNVPNVNAINNVFVNNVTSSNGAAMPQTVYFRFGTTNATNLAATTNNNVLYCGTPSVDHLMYVDGAVNALTNPQQTLGNYQALVSTRESASKTELPPFLNTTTGGGSNYLHISNVITTQLESGGIPVAGISDDYDNDARNGTTPDIGADEFNGIAPVILDLSINALTSPANVSCFTGSENVIVQIRNAGNQPWDFSNGTFARTISGTVTNGSPAAFGPITITNAMNGGVPLAANATMSVTLGALINMQTPQTYTFNASLSASAAESGSGSGTGNDALSPAVTRTSTNPTVTLSSNSPVCANAALSLTANSSGGNNNVTTVLSGSASPNAPIPDISLTGASSTIAIAGGGNILPATAIDITLNITHTFNGDIDAYLVGPGNCGALELTTDNGSTSDGFSNLILHTTGAFPNVTTLPTIVGANGGNFMTELGVTTPPVAGSGTGSVSYPAVPLVALNGCPVNGTWTLFVGDDATGDVGTITNWSLSITGTAATGNYTDNFTGTGTFGSITYSGANNSQGVVGVTGAATGTYSVTTTDASGCTSAPATTPVTVHALPTGSLSNGSTTRCNNGGPATFFDVFFTVDPPGSTVSGVLFPGAIPFSGNVSPISVGVSPTVATTYFIANLSMSGAPGCSATSLTGSFTVNVDQPPTPAAAGNDQTHCSGELPVNITGNTPSIGTGVWSVSSGSATFVPASPTISVTAAGNGTNTLCWTISNGVCPSSQDCMDLIINPSPAAPSGSDVTACSNDLPATLTVTAPGGSVVDWYDSPSGPTLLLANSSTFTTSTAGTYYAESRVSPGSGCLSTTRTAITLTVNPNPPAPSVTSPVTYCQNDVAVPLTASGANLTWYPGPTGGGGSPTAPTPSTAVVGSTSYYVSQTVLLCESPRQVIVVDVKQPPNTAFAGPDQTIVNINSATMAANSAVAGTTGTWSVQSGTGTFSPNVNDPNATVTGMSVGNNVYRWTISNPPCTDSFDEMTVNFSGCPTLTPTISGTSSFCQGSSTQLCATAGFAGYSWSTGATTQCIIVSTANTFTVTVSDINGCTGTVSRTTTVNPLPSCLITGNGSICSGSSTQWCAPSGLSYLWSTGATTQCITVSTAGTRTVTVTDGNGCSSSCNKTLTVNPLPSCLITGNGSICSGSSTQWCAPSGLASYLWSTGATTQCITVSTANTFTVTVTDGNGCSSSCNKTLTVNPNPTPNISGTLSFCSGSSTQICAPAGLSSYQWSTGATTQCITVSSANTFTVTVTNANGCSGSTSATTTVNPLPSCLITGNGSICSGSSTQWCAPSGLSYLWSTGATTQCITVSTAGTRTVTVTDGNGCSSSCNKTLTVNPLPSCLITGNGSICSGSSTQWCAPSGLASYLWSTGATTQCITVSTANTFTVTVTDGNGCSSSCNKTLTVNPNPTPNISGTLSFCSGSSTQICAPAGLSSYQWSTGATTQCITVSSANTFTVTVTNANGCSGSTSATTTVNPLPSCLITGNGSICSGSSTQWCAPSGLSYLWSTGATTQCITVSTAGTRTVTVTDGNGCSSSCNKTLTVNPLPSCLITGNGSICSGSSTQWCAPSGLASYLWSTGATTQCITVSTANTFTVTVTDGNGCSSSCNKTLTVNPNPTPTISGTLSFCSGSSTQICAPAGLSSYQWSTGATTQCITVSSANTFTVTVTNANGCSGSTSATTTVNPLPTISTTGPLNLNNTPGFCSATVTNAQLMGQVTSVTGTPPPTVTFSPPAGTFPVGTTLVTATATNICGAPTSSFNVIVNDNQDPTIVCPPTVSVNTNPGVCYATNINFGNPGFGDNCSGSTVGNNALAQYPSGQFPQGGIVIQWEVTDQSGNKASCNQTVAIVDNEPPVALCKNLCVYLNSAGVAIITGADIDNGSHDNCGIDPGPNGLVASPNTFTYANAGPNTVTLTVKDINGNTSTCTSTVTVGEYYSLFGADGSCSTPTGQPDNCHVNMGNGNNITGNVGSYRLITTGGGVVINGNVISGGKVNYANGVSSKSVSAANLLGLPGLIFQTGSAANITGDINVTGNINVNPNGGSFVTGIVRHPVGTTYSGPVPGGGVLLAPAVLPALPGMPTINAYSCGGANITTTATLNPGSYGNITLGNAAGVIITFNGPGNYYFSSIKMGQGGIHTFKYDFLGLPGKINIFVCGDIDFGQYEALWAGPNTPDACRVYFETHGTGSTNGTNSVMAAIIELGSHFYGRVWAPYGGIKVGSGSCCTYATGSLWSAKQVQLEGAVTFNGCSSPCPPAPRTNEDFTATDNLNSKLQVYPNPTSGKTTVAFFTEIPYSYTLKVMDNLGRVVLSNESKAIAGDNTQEIDMSGLAKGLYLIEVGNAEHSQKVKVVVQ